MVFKIKFVYTRSPENASQNMEKFKDGYIKQSCHWFAVGVLCAQWIDCSAPQQTDSRITLWSCQKEWPYVVYV